MPFAENQGVKIYWDAQGEGVPVLLIMGLGYSAHMWHRTRPLLGGSYRTIAFDNRGVGRSDVPIGPYPVTLMAADALAVMNAAGVDRAHVYGVSMGGMIAQEFALQYPDRVRSLILGCTSAGMPNAVQAKPEVIQLLMARGQMDAQKAAEAAIPFIYDAGTPRARIDEDLAVRKDWLPRPEGYISQLMGLFAWGSYSRLDQIKVPALVIHGDTDQLVPPSNAQLIASRIPNAKLVLVPHASHIYSTDQPETSHSAVIEFLAAN